MHRTLYLLLFIIPCISLAQKQGNIWYFGNRCGLDFSSGAPVSLTGSKTGTDGTYIVQEGTASIADSAGNLLFYTGGQTIWNHYHDTMPNGGGLYGGQSSTQSSIIIPLPASDSLFYVFTSDEFQNYWYPHIPRGYRYSVVNMCLDNCRGDVIAGQKNLLLLDSSTEKLCACEDSAGIGYWVMGHKMYSNQFCAWHVTAAGISNTVVSSLGYVHGSSSSGFTSGQGQMKFNPAGTKLALVLGNNDPAILEFFDFNNATGVVSNACYTSFDSISNAMGARAYGLEFSPDGSKLYVGAGGGPFGPHIYQYNMSAGSGNCDSIKASRQLAYMDPLGVWTQNVIAGLQAGPDGKIYAVSSYHKVSRINYPNLSGLAVGFDVDTITLTGTGNQNNYTFPSFIAGFKYHNNLVHCAVNNPSVAIASNVSGIICTGTQVTFTATPYNAGAMPTYQWMKNGNPIPGATAAVYSTSNLSNGDTITIVMTSSLLSAANPTVTSNAIVISIGIVAPTVTIASPTTGNICGGIPVTFTTTSTYGGSSPVYQWMKNSLPIVGASNSPSFTSSTIQTNDTITVLLSSSLTCAQPQAALSLPKVMLVMSNVIPGINTNILPGTVLCQGTNVNFVTNITGGGSNPQYQWYKNGVVQPGATYATYSSTAISSGDTISVLLTSNAACTTPASVLSNKVGMVMESIITPTVSVATVQGSNVNTGQAITFRASYTGGGPSPTFQWLKNSVNIPFATDSIYTTSGLSNNDHLAVQMTSSAPCATPAIVQSPPVVIVINTGILTHGNSDGYRLFPNPTNGLFTIHLPTAASGNYQVINTEGKKVTTGRFEAQQEIEVTQLSSMPSGLYFVEVNTSAGRFTATISKE